MLPIEDIFPALNQTLSQSNAIVIAPPGAGKSTCLPLYLLTLPQFKTGKIVMLQPRRLAAKNIALYLSEKLGEKIGNTVGYRIRGEHKASKATRLEIITEGVLTRMLQSDPELPDVKLIIFDEFHERNIHADFSLALSLEVQVSLREDLRVLVMSATLESTGIKTIMPSAPILKSEGRSFPVDIVYHPMQFKNRQGTYSSYRSENLVDAVCVLLDEVLAEHKKDTLVFLPSAFDINRAAARLSERYQDRFAIHRLYSELSKDKQQAAMKADPTGKRKIVLTTNIAETSVTIDNIEVVIDSGLEKVSLFDVKRGVTQLRTQFISQASASQRAGRAGRLMPGVCVRMWSQEAHGRLNQQSSAQILQSDISELLLESCIWGTTIDELALIDKPSEAQIDRAKDTLKSLSIIDDEGKVTRLGKSVHALGGQLNISIMLLKSAQLSMAHQSLACAIAAVLEAKDPMDLNTAELAPRLRFLQVNTKHPIWQSIKQWHQKLSISLQTWPIEDIGIIIAFGYSSWIAKHKGEGKFSLANGAGASLHASDSFVDAVKGQGEGQASTWLAIAAMQLPANNPENALIRYAQELSYEAVKTHFAYLFAKQQYTLWDNEKGRIRAFERVVFDNIVVQQMPLPKPNATELKTTWKAVIYNKGFSALPLEPKATQFLQRLTLFAGSNIDDNFPDMTPTALLDKLEQWLLPYLEDKTSWQSLKALSFYPLLSQLLSYSQNQYLNALLPETWPLPSGKLGKIDYRENGQAVLSVRVQELFGMDTHPHLMHGRLPLTIELLSPAQRPIQTTQDIVSFWQGSYKEVVKEMKGRYPKHFWPENPIEAKATDKTKKRM